MVAPLRHRQTKEAETDMFDLQPPRHISTLHKREVLMRAYNVGLLRQSRPDVSEPRNESMMS